MSAFESDAGVKNRVGTDDGAGHHRGVDANVSVIADKNTDVVAAGVNQSVLDHNLDVLAVDSFAGANKAATDPNV